MLRLRSELILDVVDELVVQVEETFEEVGDDEEVARAVDEAEQGYNDVWRRQAGDGDPSSIKARRRPDASRRRLTQASREMVQIARRQTELRELAKA